MRPTALLEERQVAAITGPRCATLADVADALPQLYAGSSAAAYGSKLRKASALLGAPLSLLSSDPQRIGAALRATDWSGAFRGATPKAQARAFEDLVSRVVGLCERYAREIGDDCRSLKNEDGWRTIEAYVAERARAVDPDGDGADRPIFNPFAAMSVANLRRLLGSVPPTALSAAVVNARLPTITGKPLDRLRRSLRFFDNLVIGRDCHAAIAHLLPAQPIGPVLRRRPSSVDWSAYPPALETEVAAALVAVARTPETVRDDALAALGAGIDPEAALAQARLGKAVKNVDAARKSAGVALRWLIREAEAAEALSAAEMSSLGTVIRYDVVAEAVKHWKARAAASDFIKNPHETATLHSHLSRLEVVARRALGDPREAARIAVLRLTDSAASNPYTREMAKDRADFVAHLRSTPEAVEALIEAPRALAAEAERELARWNTLDRTARMRALRRMIGAMWLGLQMCRPVRTGDLRRYASAGAACTFWAPKTPRGMAGMTIRAKKNQRRLPTEIPADIWRITSRWIEVWRARWIETMSFADSDLLVPGGCAYGGMSEQGVANIWADAAATIGLPNMTPHMARHTWATIYLTAHPGDYETVSSLLGDEIATVRAHYGHDDGHEAAARLRRLLEARRPDLFRRPR